MSALEKIQAELKSLGYKPFTVDNTPAGKTIFINYTILNGKYANKQVLLGFSFQEEGYPEYPPHWIHISPPLNDQLGGSTHSYKFPDNEGTERDCLSLSRPPGVIWDNLPTKNMENYLILHITRFCKDLK